MLLPETENELITVAKNDGIEKFVAGAFIMRDGKLLVVKRAAGDDFLPNLDEIPSGGVDEGETLAESLIREVKEETGLDIVSIDKYINHFDYISGSGKRSRQLNFLVTVADYNVVLNPVEHSQFYWITPEDAGFPDLNFSDEVRKIIKDFIKRVSC